MKREALKVQRKEVNVELFKSCIVRTDIKDLDFPADEDKIIQFVHQRNSDDESLSKIKKIEDRQYQNVSDVSKAAGMVY